ncbi:hypothetical protein PMAYCL1PPCAC_20881, partial [Pristionchus mayeri]
QPPFPRPTLMGATKTYAVKGSLTGSGMERICGFRSFANPQIMVKKSSSAPEVKISRTEPTSIDF